MLLFFALCYRVQRCQPICYLAPCYFLPRCLLRPYYPEDRGCLLLRLASASSLYLDITILQFTAPSGRGTATLCVAFVAKVDSNHHRASYSFALVIKAHLARLLWYNSKPPAFSYFFMRDNSKGFPENLYSLRCGCSGLEPECLPIRYTLNL